MNNDLKLNKLKKTTVWIGIWIINNYWFRMELAFPVLILFTWEYSIPQKQRHKNIQNVNGSFFRVIAELRKQRWESISYFLTNKELKKRRKTQAINGSHVINREKHVLWIKCLCRVPRGTFTLFESCKISFCFPPSSNKISIDLWFLLNWRITFHEPVNGVFMLP